MLDVDQLKTYPVMSLLALRNFEYLQNVYLGLLRWGLILWPRWELVQTLVVLSTI
jgi:hypothetical protein